MNRPPNGIHVQLLPFLIWALLALFSAYTGIFLTTVQDKMTTYDDADFKIAPVW